MLIEIHCDEFREKSIAFKPGLNVVLGDDNGSNSIGKTSLLLVIDFAFGGNSLIEQKQDIVKELGHHIYDFKLAFGSEVFSFRRGTLSPNAVYLTEIVSEDVDGEEGAEKSLQIGAISLEKYCAFLSEKYGLDGKRLSFRQVVGLFSRIWGKGNLDVRKPLHAVPAMSAGDCVKNLIKLFERYDVLSELETSLEKSKEADAALNKAFANKIINKISASSYKENNKLIEGIAREISEIQNNLARYMVNLSEIVNRELMDLRGQKDQLLEDRFSTERRLVRVRDNLSENRRTKSKSFEALLNFFPEINSDRLSSVEEFHSDMVRLLRTELRASEKNLASELARIESEIERIDAEMSEALSTTDAPAAVVSRVVELTRNLESSSEENRHYEDSKAVKGERKDNAEALIDAKIRILKEIELEINSKIKEIMAEFLEPSRRSPMIKLGANNYSYDVYEDTGTGTAYNSLVLFDLAVLGLTSLPMLIHDSLLFKNIENDSLARTFSAYAAACKQTFISIDEKEKYGEEISQILTTNSVVKLDRNSLLYSKDWRRN